MGKDAVSFLKHEEWTVSIWQASLPWRRRMGGTAYTALPTALSCRVGYDANRHSFKSRWQLLERLAARLTASHQSLVRFEPAVPQCCHAHCYLKGSAEQLDAARDAALAETGVRIYRKLRCVGVGPNREECYFEWVVGPEQLKLSEDLIMQAWDSFLRALS